MIGVRSANHQSVCGKTFSVVIFSDPTNMMNVKLCMMVVLIVFYPFISLLVTVIVFQGHNRIKLFLLKILCSY